MRFSPWQPIREALAQAPREAGVLQTRGDSLLPLPRGKSAMRLYAASAAGQPLDQYLRTPAGARLLERAQHLGAHLVRFATTADPQGQLRRLADNFQERFGALPAGNQPQHDHQDQHMSGSDGGKSMS